MSTRKVQTDYAVAALPLDDNAFDGCRSERLFQHLLHPEQVLAEMVRVTRPGGTVVVVDTDWGTSQTNCPDPHFERRLIASAAEHRLRNPYSGRSSRSLLRHAGRRSCVGLETVMNQQTQLVSGKRGTEGEYPTWTERQMTR